MIVGTYSNRAGFTLVELLVAIGIFAFVSLAAVWIFIISLRSNTTIWGQLIAQNNGRRAVQQMVEEIRRAEDSSIGAYAIASASSTEFQFYANTDTDSERELVRYALVGTDLVRGVVEPAGSPASYDGEEDISIIATDLLNGTFGVPLFSYLGAASSTDNPLTDPVVVTDVRAVHIRLELEESPDKPMDPLHVETVVSIRNVKEE